RRKMRKATTLLIVILSLLLVLTVVTGCGQSSGTSENDSASSSESSEVITWRFVSAFVPNAAEHYGYWMFHDRVNEELGDRLKIEYLGGTEIVAYFDQFEQLGKGVFEVGHIPVNM